MTSRQHHYVPQCYLKGFARHRNKPKVFVADIKEKKTFTTSPKNVAVERDFHRFDVDGLSPDVMENEFSRFEGDLSQALERIMMLRSFKDNNDRALLFNFIALMAIKNPRLRERTREFRERLIRMKMELITETPARWNATINRIERTGAERPKHECSYDEIREYVRDERFKLELYPMSHLRYELSAFEKILPCLFARKWVLFKAPPKCTGFVTSDHPMCLLWSDPKLGGSFRSPGLALGGTCLWFPISNELVDEI